VLVDCDNQPIGGRLKEIRKVLRSKDASQEAKDEAIEEMNELKENAKSLTQWQDLGIPRASTARALEHNQAEALAR
jgi:hypothetical protein